MIKKSKYLTTSSIILVIFFTTCQQDPDSPPDDPIECPDGYHICGSDSTDCCLDTTSHNFVWEIDTLGSPDGSNWLYDVAIIDENNVWVVGEIEDDSGKFNAAHWNGGEWELIRIAPPPFRCFFKYPIYL